MQSFQQVGRFFVHLRLRVRFSGNDAIEGSRRLQHSLSNLWPRTVQASSAQNPRNSNSRATKQISSVFFFSLSPPPPPPDSFRLEFFLPCRMRFFSDWSRDGVFAHGKTSSPRFPIRFRPKIRIFLLGFRSYRGEEGFPAAEASALQVPASERISRGLSSWRRRKRVQWY